MYHKLQLCTPTLHDNTNRKPLKHAQLLKLRKLTDANHCSCITPPRHRAVTSWLGVATPLVIAVHLITLFCWVPLHTTKAYCASAIALLLLSAPFHTVAWKRNNTVT